MKKARISTLFTVLALIAVGIYILYQVTANLTQQIRTVDVLEVTVEDKISARGMFVREQLVVTASGKTGTEEEVWSYLNSVNSFDKRSRKLCLYISNRLFY